ncbi:CBS domain-containing protein [Arsenicitalea aurantiaca]|uniref:CBS domain-containing protein n=1 Tax=Arsenicitalea aurantiaca TaxID=1783274 RepID=A0A433XLP3_9HYPH|nr:CBS domain-containing protein [Arsenicitalea aurantiaca]RUT34995.1 CBS domain-containing protein [Arsenicitalea aurantiaca]
MRIETILNTKGPGVHTIPVSVRIADAVNALNANRIGAVVVTGEDGSVAGILSERDIVRRMGADPTAFLQTPVSETMTRDVVHCTRDDTVDHVLELMTERRIRHMPVCEDRRLIGIVSIGDLVKIKIEMVTKEAEALKEYITS